jgi:hypothetical protein
VAAEPDFVVTTKLSTPARRHTFSGDNDAISSMNVLDKSRVFRSLEDRHSPINLRGWQNHIANTWISAEEGDPYPKSYSVLGERSVRPYE